MHRTRRIPPARAIIYASSFGRLSLATCNELLVAAGLGRYRVDPDGDTWRMLLRNEVPLFEAEPATMGELIYRPQSVSELRRRTGGG